MKKITNMNVHGIEHQLLSRIDHLIKTCFSEGMLADDVISIELYTYIYPAVCINLESKCRKTNHMVWETIVLSEHLQTQIEDILLKIFMYSFKHQFLTTWNKMKLTLNKHQCYRLERYLDEDLDVIVLDRTRCASSHVTAEMKQHILSWSGLNKQHPRPWLSHG